MIPAFMADWANKKKKKEEDDMIMGKRRFISPEDRPDNQHVYNPPKGPVNKEGNPREIQTKGGGAPRVPTPMEEAEAANWLAQQNAARETAAAQTAAEKKAAEDAATRNTASAANTAAYNTARNYGNTQASASGYNADLLNKYGVLDAFYADLENQKSGIDPMDITPTYNTSSPWSNAVATGQGRYRTDTTKAINTAAGTGFENQMIADTSDDAILSSILQGQNENAFNQIDMAYKRGQLSAEGYQNALKQLETANTAGMGSLQSIGGGVLGGYRTGLTNLKNNALNTAGGLTLADTYDINAFTKALGDFVNTSNTNMKGDIFNAVGDQQFFDPTKIIGLAGAQQGYYNPTSSPAPVEEGGAVSPLLQQMTDEEKKRLAPNSTVF